MGWDGSELVSDFGWLRGGGWCGWWLRGGERSRKGVGRGRGEGGGRGDMMGGVLFRWWGGGKGGGPWVCRRKGCAEW